MGLNSSEYDLYRKLKRIPIDQMLEILARELGTGPYLDYRNGRWAPTLECWKLIRQHGWTSKDFMNTPPIDYEINR